MRKKEGWLVAPCMYYGLGIFIFVLQKKTARMSGSYRKKTTAK
jgi:hypothetical protein